MPPIGAAMLGRMMVLLLAAAILWVGVHVGIAGTAVRARLVQSLGEVGFRIGYSLISVVSITLLVMAWQAAPYIPLWDAPDWYRWLMALLMLPIMLLFVASVATPNPTAVGGKLDETGPRGIQRITRHPMLWSFALWALVHVLGNGDLASVIFFGTFAISALIGMPSIDRKLAARDPEAAAKLQAVTSILPFGAIMAGRNRLVLAEIGWVAPVLALLGWAVTLHFHARFFGVPALMPF